MVLLEKVLEAHIACAPKASKKHTAMTWAGLRTSNDAFIASWIESEFNWADELWRPFSQITTGEPCIFDKIANTGRTELMMNER